MRMWATPRSGRDATRTTLRGPRPLGADHDRLMLNKGVTPRKQPGLVSAVLGGVRGREKRAWADFISPGLKDMCLVPGVQL